MTRDNDGGVMRPAARALAAAGWPIFPCHSMRTVTAEGDSWVEHWGCTCNRPDCGSPGKHPRTKQGVKDATSDMGQVALWWQDNPTANIGLATGKPSGAYVVDLDGDEGYGTWEAHCARHGDVQTLMAHTGGGGLHLFFTMPTQLDLGNTAKKLGPGIDTRGTGGYVLLAPSNHASGQRYAWLNGLPPAPIPQWIVDELRGHEHRLQMPKGMVGAPADRFRAETDDRLGMRIVQEECQAVASTGEGGRNHALFRAAANLGGLVAGGELTAGTVVDCLRDAGGSCGLPAWEVERTIKSGLTAGMQSPRIIRTRKAAGL